MTDRPIRVPGPDHMISITPHAGRVTITAGGVRIADTERALSLKEASYPAVLYVPRGDADLSRLTRSDHQTYCPYKGDCSYFNLPTDAGRNAVWTYETPYAAVAEIRDHLAFYPDRVVVEYAA